MWSYSSDLMDVQRNAAAFCSVCRGVLPFEQDAGAGRVRCTRCGTLFVRGNPPDPDRRRALRYLAYGSLAGLTLSLHAAARMSLGPEHPLLTGAVHAAAPALLAILAAGCVGRAAMLALLPARFERLAPHEWDEIARRLCPGMIRSDVERELSLRGWGSAKIRTVLGALRPAPVRLSGGTAPAPARRGARRTR